MKTIKGKLREEPRSEALRNLNKKKKSNNTNIKIKYIYLIIGFPLWEPSPDYYAKRTKKEAELLKKYLKNEIYNKYVYVEILKLEL